MRFLPPAAGLAACMVFFSPAWPAAPVEICEALFSRRQALWPALESARKSPPAKVGVLPTYLESYQERIPCDSCHRLSRDGMEFFLDNALRRILDSALPSEVELVGPHSTLLRSRGVAMKAVLDSLALPWDPWLDGCRDPLVYRPRDRFSREADRRRLDRVAGALGLTHLLAVRRFRVEVDPARRDAHRGRLDWGFHAALYNAAEGRFEYALRYRERRGGDLDDDLEPALAKALRGAWKSMPGRLEALSRRELQ